MIDRKYINYLNHILILPEEVKFRLDKLFGAENNENIELAKRVANIALPFFCLYQPIGHKVSLSIGSIQVITHLSRAFAAKGTYERRREMLQTAVAVFLVCSTYFEFKIGLFLSNAHDLALGSYNLACHLTRDEVDYGKAGREFFQVLSTALYLGFMMTGTLEYMWMFLNLQAIISMFRSVEDRDAGRYPEFLANVAMSLLRLYRADLCHKQILERNFIEGIKCYRDLYNRAVKGRQVGDLLGSELVHLDEKIDEKRVVLEGVDGKKYDLGSHFHAYGKSLVKGANIEFRKVVVDGVERIELEFKVNEYFRAKILEIANQYETMSEHSLKVILQVAHSKATDVFSQVTSAVYMREDEETGELIPRLEVDLSVETEYQGLGKVIIGTSEHGPLFKRVVVQMDSSKNLFDFHELLALAGLETALQPSDELDMFRLKIEHFFRVFCPRETAHWNEDNWMSQSMTQMMKVMDLRTTFGKYFGKMEPFEVLPGKVHYRIPGLADDLRAMGVQCLTATLTGAEGNEEEQFGRIASILKMGMLSKEMRNAHGMDSDGLITDGWGFPAGGDSVFMQMVTQGHVKAFKDFTGFWYGGSEQSEDGERSLGVRLLFDLKAAEMETYQYPDDNYGIKSGRDYLERLGLFEFVEQENRSPTNVNEVMVEDRIAPSLIKGIIAPSEGFMVRCIDYLSVHGLVQVGTDGTRTVNGAPVEQFFTTDQSFFA